LTQIVNTRVGLVDNMPRPTRDLVRWSETLAAIARTGLAFTQSLYDKERYEEVLKVASDIHASATAALALDHQPVPAGNPYDVVDEWMAGVAQGVPGYVTPKVAIGAIVANDHNELLLVKRADTGLWLYPTGWADVGYSAAEIAVKEVLEETGIDAEPIALAMVLDGLRLGLSQIPFYSLVFHLKAVGGTLHAHPLECLDVGWFAEDALPDSLANEGAWCADAFAVARGDRVEVLFDWPRQSAWRGQEPDKAPR
jgi:ADP-ribose pyrophosphatase YjhB (NUDIX family)